MALMPCHTLFQFYVADGKLSCQLYQRSGDIFLGVPFNIASYALLTHMVAQACGLERRRFRAHAAATRTCTRTTSNRPACNSRASRAPLPTLAILRKPDSIFDYRFDDFEIRDYTPHAAIKAPIAV